MLPAIYLETIAEIVEKIVKGHVGEMDSQEIKNNN
jgi:hypothetical protein